MEAEVLSVSARCKRLGKLNAAKICVSSFQRAHRFTLINRRVRSPSIANNVAPAEVPAESRTMLARMISHRFFNKN